MSLMPTSVSSFAIVQSTRTHTASPGDTEALLRPIAWWQMIFSIKLRGRAAMARGYSGVLQNKEQPAKEVKKARGEGD